MILFTVQPNGSEIDYKIETDRYIDECGTNACAIAVAALPELMFKSRDIVVSCEPSICERNGHVYHGLRVRKGVRFGDFVTRSCSITAAFHDWAVAGTVVDESGIEVTSIDYVLKHGFADIRVKLTCNAKLYGHMVVVDLGTRKIDRMFIGNNGKEFYQFVLL